MTDPIQLESPAANINRSRYSGKDFFTFVDDIVARIQALFVTEFNDFVASGTGQMLIDIVAWAAETLSFYVDRQATESYISTARTRKAVNRLARQLGYKMAASVSAVVDLQVNLGDTFAFDVPITTGFQFQGPNGLIFEAVEDVTFPAGEGPNSVSRKVGVREGETKVEVFVSDGTKNQIFRLNPGTGKSVAGGSVSTRVDGVFWEESEIITFDQTDQFEIGYNDEPPTVRFGNGVAGNVPSAGAEIRVEYVANSGSAGLVQSETITDVVSPLVVFATIIPLTIINQTPSAGGADQESLARAKTNAPKVFKTRSVAVTREDYESLAGAFTDPLSGTVAVAQAFVARGASEDLQLQVLLANIRAIADVVSENVTDQTDSIASDLDGVEDDLATIIVSQATTTAQLTAITPLTASARAAAQTCKNSSNKLDVDISDIQGHTSSASSSRNGADNDRASIETLIATFPTAGSSQLTSADRTTLEDALSDMQIDLANVGSRLDQIDAESLDLAAESSTISSQADQIISDVDGVDTATAEILDANTDSVAARTSMTALLLNVQASAIDIAEAVTTNFENAIDDELDAIFAHVDSFLSDDCKANLIEVPILTTNADGFLVEPPIALIRSLQSYLDVRKEVTQVPEVVSGGIYLVPAVIEVALGVLDGYVQQTVASNAGKAIDDLLKNRAFGKSLRKSDLDATVVPNPQTGIGGVEGVSYAVFVINGHIDPLTNNLSTEFLDANGNLIIDKRFVITKGTVAITPEEAAT